MQIKKSINNNRKELVDTLYLIMLQGINQLLPIIVMPYLMVKLGAEGYGYVGFSLSVVQYLIIIVDFGFNLSATKRIAVVAGDRIALSRVFWNVVAAKLLLMFLTTLALLVLVVCIPTFRLYGNAIIATYPMLLGSALTFMWFFQGIGRIRLFSIMNTVSKIALLPLIFVFVQSPDDYVVAALLQAVVFVSTAIISNIYVARQRLVEWIRPTWKLVKEELHVSFPLFLSSASTSVYTQFIVIVLGFYCTTEEIGKYTSAERIMRAMCFLLYVPLNQVFFPRISQLAVRGNGEDRLLFRQVRFIVLGIMLAVSVALWCGSWWLPSLLGPDYVGMDVYMRIFALAPIAIGFGGVYGQMGLIGIGNEYTSRRFRDVYFVAAVSAFVLMFTLIPFFQATGASLVVTLTEVIVALLMFYNFKKYLSVC